MAFTLSGSIADTDFSSFRTSGYQDAFLIFDGNYGGGSQYRPMDLWDDIQIDHESDYEGSGYDAYLYVTDGRGKRIASDDDGGAGLNSQLTLSWRSDWVLSVEPLGSGRAGDYTLTIDWADWPDDFINVEQITDLDFSTGVDVFVDDVEVDDVYFSGAGNDVLSGSYYDVLSAGEGNDSITLTNGGRAYGGDGHDTITAVEGDETDFLLFGEAGNDVIDASAVTDLGWVLARGGEGNDRITGGMLGDRVYGDDGNDRLDGGLGDDDIYGGDGNDVIDDQLGDNDVYGGSGADRIDLGDGADYVEGADGADRIYTGGGNDEAYGDWGNDVMDLGVGDDLAYGGDGADRIDGDDGNDAIYGGDDNDNIDGEEGDDALYGGDGADRIYDGGGADVIYGGAGDDLIYLDKDGLTDSIVFDETGNGSDRLYSFDLQHDVLDMSGTTATSLEDLTITSRGSITTVSVDGYSGEFVLMGVRIGQLDDANFVFDLG